MSSKPIWNKHIKHTVQPFTLYLCTPLWNKNNLHCNVQYSVYWVHLYEICNLLCTVLMHCKCTHIKVHPYELCSFLFILIQCILPVQPYEKCTVCTVVHAWYIWPSIYTPMKYAQIAQYLILKSIFTKYGPFFTV